MGQDPNFAGDQEQYQQYTSPLNYMQGDQAAQTFEERNPKNYAYYPSSWTQKIIPAGKNTFKSESIMDIMTGGA